MWLRMHSVITTWLSLLMSAGTLLCCALPVALVSLGFGAVVAGLTAELPWLVTLSRHEEWFFIVSAVMLLMGGWMVYRRDRACPTDPELAKRCA